MIHPDVHAAPEHRTSPLVTPDDPAEAQWDSQQAENSMVFPADLAHMHSLYALYDTAGDVRRRDRRVRTQECGSPAASRRRRERHPGPASPGRGPRRARGSFPALPVTDDQREAARAHLQAHLDTAGPGETYATNGSGTGTLVSHVPTSSSGRDEADERDRADVPVTGSDVSVPARHVDRTLDGAADEYAQAVLEITGDGPAAASAFGKLIMAQLGDARIRDSARAFDPDHDGDDDSTPAGDTDHDYFDKDGTAKPHLPALSAEGRGGDAPGDGKLPYGHVEYADNGLSADGKKRYPIDAEHVEAAWGYINSAGKRGQVHPRPASPRSRARSKPR